MCIDSAYVGNSTCTTACAKTILCIHNIDSLNISMKKFDVNFFFFFFFLQNNSFVKFVPELLLKVSDTLH